MKKSTVALIATCLAAMMFGLEISSVPVILPTLEEKLGVNFKELQWVMNAYTIACTTVLMATGTLADKYGRKLVFIVSVILFGITSLICGIATNGALLIVGRFLQGMGGGAMLICSIAILSNQFQDGKERAKAFSAWGVLTGIGLGFGPIIGSGLMQLTNWHWVFLIHVPISVLTILLITGSVKESKDHNAKKLDVWGIVTLSIAVFCLTYFITQGADLGFFSLSALAILAAAIISFLLFLLIEKKSSAPMFDFSVFKISNFSGAIFGSIGMNFSFWPFIIYLPIYFQVALHYDVFTCGIFLLAYTLPTLLMPPVGEKLSMRFQPKVVIPLGLFIIGIGFIIMMIGCNGNKSDWITIVVGMLIAGIGLGITNTPTTNTTTGSVSPDRAGMASGIDISARLITLAFNIAIMGQLFVYAIFSYMYVNIGTQVSKEQLLTISGKIAGGDTKVLSELSISSPAIAIDEVITQALVHAFKDIMLYSGAGVCIISVISFFVFRKRSL
ncbi:MAG: MFS transporter [Filimonas sp.]|nr:MFS transporter [Filimonas sp.]